MIILLTKVDFVAFGLKHLIVVDCLGVGFSRQHISLQWGLGIAEDSNFLFERLRSLAAC